ncbi:UNVERIFIED_CONTAM: hypothetical protein HHA_269470 [Hammondia hammondi]|eukprot:XP_008882342.1 hypothetical protein HHA_269470 [Hammondia hammondi]
MRGALSSKGHGALHRSRGEEKRRSHGFEEERALSGRETPEQREARWPLQSSLRGTGADPTRESKAKKVRREMERSRGAWQEKIRSQDATERKECAFVEGETTAAKREMRGLEGARHLCQKREDGGVASCERAPENGATIDAARSAGSSSACLYRPFLLESLKRNAEPCRETTFGSRRYRGRRNAERTTRRKHRRHAPPTLFLCHTVQARPR